MLRAGGDPRNAPTGIGQVCPRPASRYVMNIAYKNKKNNIFFEKHKFFKNI
jgi:hypothetical protein